MADVVSRQDEMGNLGRVFDRMAGEVMLRDRRLRLLQVIIPVGVRLSAEKDFKTLLETIVIEAQQVTNADAGTLYLRAGDELRFVIVRNRSLDVAMGGPNGAEITFPPLALYDESGLPNETNVAAYAATRGEVVRLADAYEAQGFDFSGTRQFDASTGYRTQSLLTMPLKDDASAVIGVLQLLNATDPESGAIIPFAENDVIDSLVLMASAALTGYIREEKMRAEIAQLRIEVDRVKKKKQVAEITESDYFKNLQEKVRKIREDKKRVGTDIQ
jgi:GAF domain-containing protein